MADRPELKSWSAKQAVAILSSENIRISDFELDLLKQIENGTITHKQAREEILKHYKVTSPQVEPRLKKQYEAPESAK